MAHHINKKPADTVERNVWCFGTQLSTTGKLMY